MKNFSISVKRVPHAPHAVDLTSQIELRLFNYQLYRDTHIPKEYQEECGALTCAILRAVFFLNDRVEKVDKVTLWKPDDERWNADALINDVVAYVVRGEGSTPVEALQQLIRNLHTY